MTNSIICWLTSHQKRREILSSIAADNSIEQVAAKLNINEETVRRNLRVDTEQAGS